MMTVTDYTSYISAARRRAEAKSQALRVRYERAWVLARRAAVLLRRCYAAQRVVVFGSLLDQQRFHTHSDVDLAVWGVSWPAYLHALGEVVDLDAEIEIDLIDATCCQPLLLKVIESEGVAL